MSICPKCEVRELANPAQLSFRYSHRHFTIYITGGMCEECQRRAMIDFFDRYAKEILSDGTVNWKAYKEEMAHKGEKFNIFNKILLAVGILSLDPEKHYAIYDSSAMFLGPRSADMPLYFTHQTDVLAFTVLVLKNAKYEWSIVKISDVILKRIALETVGDHQQQ